VKSGIACVVACATLLAAGPVASADLRIPLTVTEPTGSGRSRECVTTGVPFLPGQVKDAKALRLLDAEGKEVPAQFRPLARWWRKDGSLRWVLVDFLASPGAFRTQTFTLTDGRTADYDSPLKVVQTDDAITVTTGAAQFVINRKRFNLFDRVRIDINGDGEYTAEEECISPQRDAGSVVEDTYGLKYYSSEDTREVKVEEAGPVRVCVVAKGVHRAPGRKGYSRGMYGYDVRMHFYANKSTVRLDPVITNTAAEPTGSPTFEDHSLIMRLNLEPAASPNPDYEPKGVPLIMYRMYGQAPRLGELREGQSAALYQDSNGSETWQVNPGVASRVGKTLSRFRGYRMTVKGQDGERVLAAGDHARGLVSLGGNRFGVVVMPRYFWQLFPKAIEVGFDGTVRIGIFPREYRAVHWLEDASAAGQELWLHFYARGLKAPAKPQHPRDGSTRSKWWSLTRDRPWPHAMADRLGPPLAALCTPEHYAACGALADIGPYAPIKSHVGFPLEVTERRYFMTDYLKGNAYGWQVFGCRWEEYAGHSPWNYEPIGSSHHLYYFINTRHRTWLEFGYRRFKHFRDVRAYKIDGTKVFDYPTWGDFSSNNECEDYCTRRRRYPTGPEIATYSQGRYQRRGWFLPNPAHNNLDELHDLYCLFGDTRALEGARNIAAVGGAYVGLRPVGIHRATGWCFRSLLRYRDLTGSDECLPYLNKALDNVWQVAVKNRHVSRITYTNTWFYNVFGRSVVLAYDVTGDERMRDLALGMTQGRTAVKSAHPTLLAFAYDQTGHKRYLSERAASYARLGGYFPACAAHLWLKRRPDTTPPAAVTDLAALPGGAGEVRLAWTAPGDDGNKGSAAVYQIKWADLPLVETAAGKTQVNFWAAENVAGEPKPRGAGSKEAFVIKTVKPGTYYFAIKSRDEYNNESPISNVVKVEVP